MNMIADKVKEWNPILIKENENSGSDWYVNIRPLVDTLHELGRVDSERSFELLHRLVRTSMQVIGTADLSNSMHPGIKEGLLWELFAVEEALSKCRRIEVS